MGKKVLTPVRKYRLYFFTSSLASAGVNFVKRPFPSPRVARKIPLTRARALGLSVSLSLSLSVCYSRFRHPLSSSVRLSRRAPGENSSARFPPGLLKNHQRADFPRGVGETGCVFTTFFFFSFFHAGVTEFRPPFSLRFIAGNASFNERFVYLLVGVNRVFVERVLQERISRRTNLFYLCLHEWVDRVCSDRRSTIFIPWH